MLDSLHSSQELSWFMIFEFSQVTKPSMIINVLPYCSGMGCLGTVGPEAAQCIKGRIFSSILFWFGGKQGVASCGEFFSESVHRSLNLTRVGLAVCVSLYPRPSSFPFILLSGFSSPPSVVVQQDMRTHATVQFVSLPLFLSPLPT